MKIAFAGKGGAGKTSIAAWLGDHLARRGENVWLVDADTALSLGQASGLDPTTQPTPLAEREDLIRSHIGQGYMSLNPDVSHLPETLSVDLPLGGPVLSGVEPGQKRLLVMGCIGGEGGCACAANALLKAVLAHLILDRREWVLVDMEAGVEHLGRGTVADVDALVVVSEPSLRALSTASEVSRLARNLGLSRQALVLNRCDAEENPPAHLDLPKHMLRVPMLKGLKQRQLFTGSVLGLPEDAQVSALCDELLLCLDGQGAEAGQRQNAGIMMPAVRQTP